MARNRAINELDYADYPGDTFVPPATAPEPSAPSPAPSAPGPAPSVTPQIQGPALPTDPGRDNPPPPGTPPGAPPAPTPSPAPTPTSPPGTDPRVAIGQQVTNLYQQYLHRAPDANELQSDIDTILRHGPDALATQLQQRAGNRPGGTPSSVPSGGQGTQYGAGSANAAALQKLIDSLTQRLLGGSNLAQIPLSGGQPQDSPLRQQILDALQQLIKESTGPMPDTGNSPQAAQYKLGLQREYDRARSQAAERRGSQGLLQSGAFETDINAAQQQRAESQAKFESQLTNLILQDRHQRLTTALSTGAGIMTEDQRYQLQSELQQVNAALAQTQVQLQLAQSLMQNQQWYDRLGFDIGKFEQEQNNQAAGG